MSKDVTPEVTPERTPEVTELSGGELSSGKVSAGKPADHSIAPSSVDWSESERILSSEKKYSDAGSDPKVV